MRRAAAPTVGRLVRVDLAAVPLDERRKAAQHVREQDWRTLQRDLSDPFLHLDRRAAKYDALLQAIKVERAALHPSHRAYVLPEDAVEAVLGGGPNGNGASGG
jgi:hypothetical protein